MNMPKIVIPYYSASGHTHRLADAILEGVSFINSDVTLINVDKMNEDNWSVLEKAYIGVSYIYGRYCRKI